MICTKERQFSTLSDALAVADRRNTQRALMFSPVTGYWCDAHDAYHVGHLNQGRHGDFGAALELSRQRAQIRSEIAVLDVVLRCVGHLPLVPETKNSVYSEIHTQRRV